METVRLGSRREIGDLIRGIGGALHARNRTMLGESGFVWQVAEALRTLGHVFESGLASPETALDFGDGYSEGRLSDAQKQARLLAMIADRMERRGDPAG